MQTEALIDQLNSLPVEERARIVDQILRSLNSCDSDIDKKWAQAAKNRLAEIREGQTKPIAGDEVSKKIWSRFGQ